MKKHLDRANELATSIIDIRRQIHQNAECGFDLPLTVKLVMEKLREWGYSPENPCEGCVTALVGDSSKGKVIMLRADMDALPIEELTDLPFKSVTQYSHSCGHDIHTAMLLGAAKLLKEREHELNGAVKLVFQPAEELLKGAQLMLDCGVLENPKVDAAFAMHVAADYPVGTYSFREGYMMSAASEFVIDITGKGCHGGAAPQLGIDPINVGAHIHIALQELIAREVKSIDPAVLTIGSFNAGTATNIIPDTAQLKGTVRSFLPEVQEFLLWRMKEVVELIAKAFRAEAELTLLTDVPALKNDEEMVSLFVKTVKTMDPNLKLVDRHSMGCEDFALFTERIPAAYIFIGGAVKEPEERYPLHNAKIVFDEGCIPLGIATHVAYAMNWLNRC